MRWRLQSNRPGTPCLNTAIKNELQRLDERHLKRVLGGILLQPSGPHHYYKEINDIIGYFYDALYNCL